MMKYGKFKDLRSSGLFVVVASVNFPKNGHLLIAVRNALIFGKRIVHAKPGYTRWYLGPIEIERYNPLQL
jgi:hypothetical protein